MPVRWLDGDTVDVRTASGPRRVRSLGIDTPELAHDGNPEQCGAAAARDFARDRAPQGSRVFLMAQGPDHDRYGRALRVVRVPGGSTDIGGDQINEANARAYLPKGQRPSPAFAEIWRGYVAKNQQNKADRSGPPSTPSVSSNRIRCS